MWASQFWKFEEPGHLDQLRRRGHHGLRRARRHRRQGRPSRPHGLVHRRRRLLPDDRPGARRRRAPRASRSRWRSSTTPTSAWCASGRRCSTTSATARSTSAPTCPTTSSGPRRWAAWGCARTTSQRCTTVIAEANEINDVPVVIDFRTDAAEKVFPMVAAGASNDDIMVHPLREAGPVSPEPFLGDAGHTPVRHHILSVLVENKAGVLARIAGLFARRGFNIYSLAVAPAEGNAALLAGHHRRRRRVGAARADRRPARQARQRGRRSRTSPRRTPSSENCCSRRSSTDDDNRARCSTSSANAGASIVDVDADVGDGDARGHAGGVRPPRASPRELHRRRAAANRSRGAP